MIDMLKNRLLSFGCSISETDQPLLLFSLQKAETSVKNLCNLNLVPEGLADITVDMAAGEFLSAVKTLSPDSIAGLDLDAAIKQIQVGDTNTVFATDNSLSPEQRFDSFIQYLLNYGKQQFSCFRRLRW